MTEYLRVKNWRDHQHYKNKAGAPPWIKLYRKILTDYGFRGLPEADRFKLIALWLLAAETDGVIPNDPRYLADCIGAKRIDLDLLVSRGFLERVYSDSRVSLEPIEVEEKRIEGAVKTPRPEAGAVGEQPPGFAIPEQALRAIQGGAA